MSVPSSDRISQRAKARLGTVLRNKWRLERVLGVGGMATVYEATHRNQARAAIKVMHPELCIDSDITARFLREGYVANSVDHPGTVKVLDDDVAEDGAPFLVMELLEGETVEQRWVKKQERLTVTETLALADAVLDVLEHAHSKGVVHRDLKPENLFLTRDGTLKILDFGIARLRELSQTDSQTRAGSLMGTPAFMAPEQARGRWDIVDERTDIWALGATLFTLLSGHHVHEADTVQEQVIFAATVRARSLAEVAPGLPPEVVALVDRALAFDKHERWPSASGMRDALRQASQQASVPGLLLPSPVESVTDDAATILAPDSASVTTLTSRPVARTPTFHVPRSSQRGLVAIAGVLAFALVAATALYISRSTDPQGLPTEPAAATDPVPEPQSPPSTALQPDTPPPEPETQTPTADADAGAKTQPTPPPERTAKVTAPPTQPPKKPDVTQPPTKGTPPQKSLLDRRW